MKSLVSIDDIDQESISELFDRAIHYKNARQEKGLDWHSARMTLPGNILISDFFEPSTRTRFSFEAAMKYLGGDVIGTENAADFSSVKKGESIADNFKVISGYGDIIIGRFLNEGEAAIAAAASDIPLINGGDGTGEHPTQALIDQFIINEKLPLDTEITVSFVGDNINSRTVKSLFSLLSRDPRFKMNFFLAPRWKTDPVWQVHSGWKNNTYTEYKKAPRLVRPNEMEEIIKESNVVYMTRSQIERHTDPVKAWEEQFLAKPYVLTPELVDAMPAHALVLHPLPRTGELPTEVDANPRAYYFEQARNGLYVRMALLEMMLNGQ